MKNESSTANRRQFFCTSAGVTAAGLAAITSIEARADENQPNSLIQSGNTILFQGDSITDVGRKRDQADKPNDQAALGHGYAWLAAAELLLDHPNDQLRIFNRGISGNKVYQLAQRWQEDCLDLKPDLVSFLIGVNDFWHKHKHGYEGTLEIYENDYRDLLTRTQEALPEVRLVVCEPFVLRCGVIDDSWFPEFDEYRAAAKRVADRALATFVPFQAMFDEAIKYASPEHWAADGVHPTPSGAAIMAHTWLKTVGT
jgi:lysophospholipase L1-like esterase